MTGLSAKIRSVRADRLVAVLLMLQRRGQVTAAQVAEELEVSERTARRDLEALSMAGVPVYSQRGRGGGWRLAGGGSLDLSGLSRSEVQALFVLAGPRSEVTPQVRSALRKLVRALPEPLRDNAEAAATAVVRDPTGWDHGRGEPWRPPLLDEVEAAVVDRECLRIGYVGRSGEPTERVVHPLGLAAKGANWYLLADTAAGRRTFRVDRLTTATRTGEPAERPDGFELDEEWREVVERIDDLRTPVVARGTASPDAVRYLRAVFGRRVRVDDGGDDGDTVRVEVRGASERSLVAELAGFGDRVHVEEPEGVRPLLGAVGAELVRTYGAGDAPGTADGGSAPT